MYERPINPPEPILADLTVNVTGYTRGTVAQISGTIGGDAFLNDDRYADEGFRGFSATTVVTDVEDESTALDIVHNLFAEHLTDDVDLDNLIVTVDPLDDDAPDMDARWKDERIDAGW